MFVLTLNALLLKDPPACASLPADATYSIWGSLAVPGVSAKVKPPTLLSPFEGSVLV